MESRSGNTGEPQRISARKKASKSRGRVARQPGKPGERPGSNGKEAATRDEREGASWRGKPLDRRSERDSSFGSVFDEGHKPQDREVLARESPRAGFGEKEL